MFSVELWPKVSSRKRRQCAECLTPSIFSIYAVLRIALFPYLFVPFSFFCCCCSLRSRPTYIRICVQFAGEPEVVFCNAWYLLHVPTLSYAAHKLIECCPSIIKINNIFSFTIMAVHFSVNGCCGVRTIRLGLCANACAMKSLSISLYTYIFSIFPSFSLCTASGRPPVTRLCPLVWVPTKRVSTSILPKAKQPFVTDGVALRSVLAYWQACAQYSPRNIFHHRTQCAIALRIWPITTPPLRRYR